MSGALRTLALATTLLCAAAGLAAQTAPPDSAARGRDTTATPVVTEPALQPRAGIRPIAVAKWTTLAGAVAAAVYGYHQNRLADSRYEDLDRVCQAQPSRCLGRTAGGAYQDAELEARYQDVKRLDHRAALGLVGAEIGVATSVTLFLLDLHHTARNPPNIPYNPPRFQVGPGREGGVEMRVRVR